MSRPIPPDGIAHREPDEQVRFFASMLRSSVNAAQAAWFEARCEGLGMVFGRDEMTILAALDTPAKVQAFLNENLYYNDDHASEDQEETSMPPRRVLETGMAHCFEGAMFAYAVNFLHRRDPKLVLLEASQDADHNLVVCRDPRTRLYGANAHSRYKGLDGRPAEHETIRALAESYLPYYYSDRTLDPKDLTLVGFSDEIDIIARYGMAWIDSREPLWDIYYTYIDDSREFHYFSNDPGRPHHYPLIRALEESWIRFDAQGKPFVSVADLPPEAQEAWAAFWRTFRPEDGPRPRGPAHEIEAAFMRATGTTPIDLSDNAFDLQFYLAAGYRIDQLLRRYAS